jgi:hypothetical protein
MLAHLPDKELARASFSFSVCSVCSVVVATFDLKGEGTEPRNTRSTWKASGTRICHPDFWTGLMLAHLPDKEVGPRIFFIFRVFRVFRGCGYL